MFDDWNFKQAPTGLFRWVLHVPAHLYRYHLGFLLGERLVLITHEGRMSGRRYQTPVEVVERLHLVDSLSVAARLDRGVVSEDVCAALIGSDEPEALLRVEPLDGALRCHELPY